VQALVDLFQVFNAGLNSRVALSAIFSSLEPTGSGKTRIVEACGRDTFWRPHAPSSKSTAREFQHSHEIAKLIGSPQAISAMRNSSFNYPGSLGGSHSDKLNASSALRRNRKSSDALGSCSSHCGPRPPSLLATTAAWISPNRFIFLTSNLGAGHHHSMPRYASSESDDSPKTTSTRKSSAPPSKRHAVSSPPNHEPPGQDRGSTRSKRKQLEQVRISS